MANKKHNLTSHDPVNVKNPKYAGGAKGDGSTIDDAAILAAVHDAFGYQPYNEGFGQPGIHLTRNLYFPAGHYIITTPILLTHVTATRIFGDGKGATLIENISTDPTKNKSPWPDAHDKYYPNRSVFATDGFSYSQVEQMSLKCNGGICFNHSWARVPPYPPYIVGDTISSQEVQYRDVEFIGGYIGLCMGWEIIPDGGFQSVYTTGNLVNEGYVMTGIPSTNLLFPGMYAEVYHNPFVTGGDGLMIGIRVSAIIDANTVELQHWNANGTFTFTLQPTAGSTITLNGTVVTFVASAPSGNQVLIGGDLAATLTNLLTFLEASEDAQIILCTYLLSGMILYVTLIQPGTSGNGWFTLSSTVTGVSLSGSTLEGGQNTMTATESNAPIHFTMHGEMTSECIAKNCDFINCSYAGLLMGNGNALSMASIGGYYDSCRTGILVGTGACPVIRGPRFHNSTEFDISIDWAAGGDGYSVKGAVSDSVNFARFRAGTNPIVVGCTHKNATEGVFLQIDTPGTLFVEGSYSQNGKINGNGAVAIRGSTFGNANKLSSFTGSILEDI